MRRGRPSFGVAGVRTRAGRNALQERRQQRPRILIVCEGKKTEPSYFLAFNVTNDVHGGGLETIRVVEEAIRINDEEGLFEQIWCVFDKDDFPAADFDNAISMIESCAAAGFRAAYSNEAFELWYVLHFEYLNSALNRRQYIEHLDRHLGRKYRKGDAGNYELLRRKGNEEQAIKNAERLRQAHETDEGHKPPSRRCPVTMVDELVGELRKYQNE